MDAFALFIYFNRILPEICAKDRGQPCKTALLVITLSGDFQRSAIAIGQRHAHGRVGHSEALDDIGNGEAFTTLGFQEFKPCRCGIKQISHINACAMHPETRGGLRLTLFAALNREFPCTVITFGLRGNGQARDRTD